MKPINKNAWDMSIVSQDTTQGCSQGHNEVSIKSFGLIHDQHPGFRDDHDEVPFLADGRSIVRAGRKNQIVFRWSISGWAFVKDAVLCIFRWGSNRPVGLEQVRQADGQAETYGTVAGFRLTDEDQKVLLEGRIGASGGPYMARLHIRAVQDGTRVVVGALRTYFDVLPLAIVGAGAAGLRAAATLLEKNDAVIILEARDRVGGRGWTVPSSAGAIDLGCQWMHSASENPWLQYAPGAKPHEQDPISLHQGKPLAKAQNMLDLAGEAISVCEAGENVQQALQRIAPVKTLNFAREGIEAEITQKKEQLAKQAFEEGMTGYDPAKDLDRVKDQLKSDIVAKDKELNKKEKQATLSELVATAFKAGGWQTDENFLKRVRSKKERSMKSDADKKASEWANLQLVDTAIQKEAQRRATQYQSDWMKDPWTLLELAKECELEEAADAEWFTAKGRHEAELFDEDADSEAGKSDSEQDEEQPAQGENIQAASEPKWKPPAKGNGFEYVDPPEPAPFKYSTKTLNFMDAGGFGTVIEKYAERLSQIYRGLLTIALNQIVTKVEFKQSFVLLHLTDAVIPAWAVVMTAPMGVLQAGTIKFEPDLPSPVKKAISSLKMGSYKKIVLILQEDSDLVKALHKLVDQHVKEPAPQNGVRDLSIFGLDEKGKPWKFLYRIKEKIVVCFVGGSLALTLDAESNTEKLRDASLRALAYVLGLSTLPPAVSVKEILTSRWSEDKFSRGAYTYTVPGGVGSRKLLLGTIVHDRMVFAGEALWYEEYGTAHGAYLTGEMAAKQLQVLPLATHL